MEYSPRQAQRSPGKETNIDFQPQRVVARDHLFIGNGGRAEQNLMDSRFPPNPPQPLRAHLYNFAWLPSHITGFPLCLQPQKYTVFDSVASNFTGLKSVALWLPSQNGWLALRPQEHQE
jgi:hypothetical protein